MNKFKDDGGPAFPRAPSKEALGVMPQNGMTLRDWFAGQVLAAMAEKYALVETSAWAAYEFADAMIEARRYKEEGKD